MVIIRYALLLEVFTMNKIVLNSRGRNHIKFLPLNSGVVLPDSEGDRIRWAESVYNELLYSNEAERLFVSKRKGYLVTAWQLNGLYYLTQCIRNISGTYNTTIYINNEREDTINIAKFLRDNAINIMSDIKKQWDLLPFNANADELPANAESDLLSAESDEVPNEGA